MRIFYHLTSLILPKLTNYFWSVFSDPDLHTHPQTPSYNSYFHFPLLNSLQRTRRRPKLCQNWLKMSSVYSATRPNTKLENHPCRLSATTRTIYLQLPSISGGCLLQPQTEGAPCRGKIAWQPHYSICKSKRVLECSPIITYAVCGPIIRSAVSLRMQSHNTICSVCCNAAE